MSTHDPSSEGAHAHVRYSRILDGGGRVTHRVDLLVGDRTQKGIDEHLVALIRPDNLASQAVARSLGMEVERTAYVHGGDALVFTSSS